MNTIKQDKKSKKWRVVNASNNRLAKKPLSGKPIDDGGFDTIIEADRYIRKEKKK